ncbi:MAG: putative O-glycosylation ligase, exosortase A system-associated [Candidatus Auribacterota bacterium]
MKRLLLTFILTFSGIFGSFKYPLYGICIYIWFAYWRPLEYAWGVPGWFMAMRPSLLLALSVILGSLMNKERVFVASKFTILLTFLWIQITISSFHAVTHERGMFWLDYFSKQMIIIYVISGVINNKKRLTAVIIALILTIGYFSGKCGLFGLMNPGGKIFGGHGGMFLDNNCFALAFNMLLPFIFFAGHLLPKGIKYSKHRIGLKILFFLSILGVVFTYSRGGFLGLCVVLLMINLRSKRKVLSLIIVGAMIAIIGTFFLPEEYKERLGTIVVDEEQGEEREASSASRIHFWKVAMIIANNYPIIGIGPGCYPDVYDYYDFSNGLYGTTRAVHNTYFQMLTNNGYPGLVLMLLLMFFGFTTCMKLRRRVKRREDLQWIFACANMMEISLAAYCVCGMFLSAAYADLFYHLIILIACLDRMTPYYLNAPPEQEQATEAAPAVMPSR